MSFYVIYHRNCSDGLAAALAVRKYLWDNHLMRGSKFETAQYGDAPPDVTGYDVVIVDFSYPRETLEEMRLKANSLLVIDHHETAQAELSGLDYCIFDMSKSGAVLAWEHFFPGEPLPKLMEYVQDRDLWRWELPFSQEVSAALRGYKPFLSLWEQFLEDTAVAKLVGEGAPLVAYQQRCIDIALNEEAPFVGINGYSVPCVNATHLISEICNALLAKYPDVPFAAAYFDTPDKRVFSLRSEDGRVNVAEVAKAMGGGGHAAAAGFTVEKPKVI